jgi:hypothetical protein
MGIGRYTSMIEKNSGKDANNLLRLWEKIGDCEDTDIAEYAAKHLRGTGRPLRIAVNEAYWRWYNFVRIGKSFLVACSLQC